MSLYSFTDQMGHQVRLEALPNRIVSLVPSQSELLAYLGVSESLVGVTKFCIHPEHLIHKKQIVGGTKNFRFDVIDELRPDLIIGNKEENYKEGILQLKAKYQVWMSDVNTVNDALSMICEVGKLVNKEETAALLAEEIKEGFETIQDWWKASALYLIWNKPYMAVAEGTFIHEVMKFLGFSNVLAGQDRYPELTIDQISGLNPEVIFLSSEPYPFKQKHIYELQEICPSSKIVLVDGELFSWYGSRLKLFPTYLKNLGI